jgi:ribosomal protein S18 acetylase RimI-like enzyme
MTEPRVTQQKENGMSAPRDLASLITVDPTSALAQQALRSYWEDIVSRYRRRPATPQEVARVLREEPSDDLNLPHGLLVVAVAHRQTVGCGGVRLHPDDVAELTRIHVAVPFRRCGVGTHIVRHLEQRAIAHRKRRMRLDVRSDLIEARAMYRRLGYHEVPRFNDHRYVEHWFEKHLWQRQA